MAVLGRRVRNASSLPLKGKSRLAAPARENGHKNHLLDALPIDDYSRLRSQLELVPMKLGEVLYEPGARLQYVLFPHHSHRFSAVCHGGWCVGRDRGRGQ